MRDEGQGCGSGARGQGGAHESRCQPFLPATEMGEHLVTHGDGVKDIAFEVEDCDYIVQVRAYSSRKGSGA